MGFPQGGGAVRTVPAVDVTAATAGTDVILSNVTGDTNDRFVIDADGSLNWGPGNTAQDSSLFRSGNADMTFGGSNGGLFRLRFAAATAIFNFSGGPFFDTPAGNFSFRPAGGLSVEIGAITGGDGIKLGSTGDVNVYRSAADKLATNDGLALLNGALAGATNVGSTVYSGTGAPNNANGANGDIYIRVDGGALTTIYQRRAGAWVGIV